MSPSPVATCADGRAVRPLAFIIDDEEPICQLIAMTLTTLGVASESFHAAKPAIAALAERRPAVIFLDIALAGSDAVHVVKGLSGINYDGPIQLMSGGNAMLVEAVQRIGARHGLTLRPPLQKPFRREAIREVVASLGLGTADSNEAE
jgi:FixJ family two-component response regulator